MKGNLRFRVFAAGVEGSLVGIRCNDLGNDTQVITKEERPEGRKHSDQELINSGLHLNIGTVE